ncbi:DUF4443 domain-containing protein [Candidatus Hecatella orcuttiae]|uniref:DUF4443 domain-containing protein n=1 Tax=Candidatus Hecatella orcuttiae TaxID=1935119 RepID=UPI00286827BC|nr:DUF4443 domain-containing protein [Candidatus Hecatella orcuttiae]
MHPLRMLAKIMEKAAPGPGLTFLEAHVMKALELIGDEKTVGRIRLAGELKIGEGAVRTLLRHMKNLGLIKRTRRGNSLTDRGKELYDFIKTWTAGPVEVPKSPLFLGKYNAGVLVKKAAGAVRYGLEQRDAALKAGALGATTLIYRKGVYIMPGGGEENCLEGFPEIRRRLEDGLHPKEGDVIIIGSADREKAAELGAKAAGLETLKQLHLGKL